MNINEVVYTGAVNHLHHRMDANCGRHEVNNESHFIDGKQSNELPETGSLTNDRLLSIRNVTKIINEHPIAVGAVVGAVVGSVASGAAAIGTAMNSHTAGGVVSGFNTVYGSLLGMGPAGWGVTAAGLGAAAVGGAIYLLSKK